MSKQATASAPTLATRVIQGVVLGVVLAIPVVLWGVVQAQPPAVAGPDEAAPEKTVAKTTVRKAPVTKAPRRPLVVAREVETIPASQMHIRIDTGARTADTNE